MANYDENELNVAEGLEYSMDSEEFYIEILRTYLEETQDELNQMDAHLASGDMNEYATLVHAIKSGSRLIGASNLGEEAFDLEMKSKDGDIDYVRSKHDHLKEHVAVVFEAINGYLADKE